MRDSLYWKITNNIHRKVIEFRDFILNFMIYSLFISPSRKRKFPTNYVPFHAIIKGLFVNIAQLYGK